MVKIAVAAVRQLLRPKRSLSLAHITRKPGHKLSVQNPKSRKTVQEEHTSVGKKVSGDHPSDVPKVFEIVADRQKSSADDRDFQRS
jgi:hypothetical protein